MIQKKRNDTRVRGLHCGARVWGVGQRRGALSHRGAAGSPRGGPMRYMAL
eukprot:gene18191-biopygen6897